MSRNSAIAIGLLIEKFQEFLEYIFEPKKKTNLEELEDLNKLLKSKYDLSILEILENDFNIISLKLKNVENETIDKMIVFLFNLKINNKNPKFLSKFDSVKMNNRLLVLIDFMNNKTQKISLERSNIKNSLLHSS